MRPDQWTLFKAAARRQQPAPPETPLALIIDSPWIPGWMKAGHLDYFLDPELWFQANLRFAREFPEVIPFPGWWMEFGMAAEPSAFGTRLHFWADQPPGQTPVLFRAEDIEGFKPVNPRTDGFMPLILARYRMQKQRILDAGYVIPVVTARGPLCTASFVRGVNEFMMDLVENPEAAHKLIQFSTETVIHWLEAQAEVLGPGVEAIFVLDDIVGFLSKAMYREFAAPYLKQICDAFPREWIKVYHNDAKIKPFLSELPDTGFDVLNFTHNLDIGDVDAATGGRLCLMGNVNPLEIGVRGTPEQVEQAARAVLERMSGKPFILSLGGGVSPGMPEENIRAMIRAVRTRP
jgi:uroporphyrinogen-III decarboxylase